ncbi:hypothetical protein EX30DRAFT_347997 [Ascodesmis nigricans]|uniref:Retrotransposon gag domain-containing protein n=1 Tax=Ascodesmis nigricans TaxID=341454 RepID=A0A4S2MZ75_9PEZI|nr:hypothetical protein EX30DRAFT_347997 [Ascodesmis nigricans]
MTNLIHAMTPLNVSLKEKSFFSGLDEETLPYFNGTENVQEVFTFLSEMERKLKRRSMAIEWPNDIGPLRCKEWVEMTLDRLTGNLYIWGNVHGNRLRKASWETFMGAFKLHFAPFSAIRDESIKFEELQLQTETGMVADFNVKFLRLMNFLNDYKEYRLTPVQEQVAYEMKVSPNSFARKELIDYNLSQQISGLEVTLYGIMDYVKLIDDMHNVPSMSCDLE